MSKTLCVMKCMQHGYMAISIDDPDGHGIRVTPDKCCGSWKTIRRFEMSKRNWEELARFAEEAAEEQEKA